SERYPLTSQLIQENKIPEFDNLYLDFNGIIHNCSHPNDEDAHFRLSEDQIFTSIFAYVDHLFSKIKPKKLFFMAVDGVAPRAKMNQQRSRRFRTAKEAKEVREKAERKGEKLPDEKAFDSNCITPGTPFMARLSEQLRYFVNKKISEDSNWRDIKVVLSGHEVPGEGEHKIMEYIRLSRAQPDYNPNIRHCLYGLDADLIMLGLLSHDPHFCLLREEVNLESINFYLLHLCLMREYLDLEFHDIEPMLPFEYSLERVIDDFILLAVFVGNDFLPNLPDLHIHENGLEKLFEVYKKVLPGLDGYINESGVINVKRLQVILDEMAQWEQEVFEKEYADLNWYKGKQAKHMKEMEMGRKRSQLVLTRPQREIFDKVKAYVLESRNGPLSKAGTLSMLNTFPARERAFITRLAEDLHLNIRWDEYDKDDNNILTLRLPGVEWEDMGEEDADDEESRAAVDRILQKYDKAPTFDDEADGGFEARYERSIKEKMDEWKRGYYQGKLEFSHDNPKAMGDLVYRYVEGLQWVMHYYYSGVASWSWFYNYHYAPRISDLRDVDKMTFDFELGTPFKPFEQLMGVLPAASMEHIPGAYRDLMYDANSPILDFYPTDFEQDLNGKKQDWEAIVKIPFIDESRLLKAMASREHRLTPEERKRNAWGTSTRFIYNPGEPTVYPSSLPGFFPTIHRCYCKMEPFDLPTLDGLHLVPGLCDGVFLGAEALAGFPSLKTLPHTAVLDFHGVKVHGSASRNKSMVVKIDNPYEGEKTEEVARTMVGKRTFMGWPFLQEGLVVAVSDSLFKYEKMSVIPGSPPKVVSTPHAQQGLVHWKNKSEGIESDKEVEQAVQMCLSEVASEDPRFLEREPPSLKEEFPEGSKVFFLGEHAYGVAAQVTATTDTSLSVVLAFFPTEKSEIAKLKAVVDNRKASRYFPSFKAAERLGLSPRALSRITSSFMVIVGQDKQKINIGLSLKFEAKALKVVDYTRKNGRYWEYSEKAVELISVYKTAFPEIFRCLDVDGDAIALASDVFRDYKPDERVREVKGWLKAKGVSNFEPVSLFCDQLSKETVAELEALTDSLTKNKQPSDFKKAIVKGIPRQAVLKPGHAVYRLQNQKFQLGDRVTMVRDSGAVPLSVKGIVIGLNTKSMDVLWDVPFMSGVTLGDRCSAYRGMTVEFSSCLNLSNPQFITSTKVPAPPPINTPFNPRFGPYPQIQPAPGQRAAAGFRPAPTQSQPAASAPIQIMSNPNRSRGGFANGRGGHPQVPMNQIVASGHNHTAGNSSTSSYIGSFRGGYRGGGRGFVPMRGRGGFFPPPNGVVRGGPRGGIRGRGRGSFPPVAS
ncbi:5'-3' exoribonuclease 1, partial [Leucoagaricus sp. SymC.cos]